MNQLREIRNQKKFSQLTLAKLTDIAPSDISRIENGWLRPYSGWRKKLAKALGVPEHQIFPEE
jgi:transcriptional regulator with XRE-family HTH domain